MTGYAMCNGQNGTINKAGKVGLCYGGAFNVIGATGGSETHTLTTNQMPIHHHHTDGSPFKSFAAGSGDYGNNSSSSAGADAGDNGQLAIGN